MEKSWRSVWVRWTLVFLLLSLGFSIFLGGLNQAVRDREPFMAFLGYWIAQAAFVVAPGIIFGGIVALSLNKPLLGGKIMISVNAIIAAMIISGAVLQSKG